MLYQSIMLRLKNILTNCLDERPTSEEVVIGDPTDRLFASERLGELHSPIKRNGKT
jgi:hypothetical protein